MKVSFDSRGYLKPYHKLELEFNEFKEIFVDAFDHTSSRHLIFENYSRFLQDFQLESRKALLTGLTVVL